MVGAHTSLLGAGERYPTHDADQSVCSPVRDSNVIGATIGRQLPAWSAGELSVVSSRTGVEGAGAARWAQWSSQWPL
ncbi:hypothetical protein STVIR_7005 [Streptomyces viridochromogenes Tue57]|uniref:Uncharacterized protein n=1 Tax=Streptomyces viridochromogenes Tue57 TaxID=1160705 RepID=L8P7A7_STRVR|nr:hypothetical protein STVIR_7005 [Streptomyces viridochromogenes Tue57]